MSELSIAKSALKHLNQDNISIEDVIYIIEHPLLIRLEAEEPYLKQLYLGFDPKTRVLEAVTVEFRDNEETIIHAMKATKEHRKLLELGRSE
ncbi:MAG: DUF4258 domain-containing protein [Coriobacteriales bacterium]|jgi:hypothetical protein|nr:DUF4258 domain-containing protein [Coriobacteriales bacterium]